MQTFAYSPTFHQPTNPPTNQHNKKAAPLSENRLSVNF